MICVKGDVLKTPFQIIAHQVNCKGVMGAGLAKQIRDNYPNLYNAYKDYCNYGAHLGDFLGWATSDKHYILNIFAQDDYGRDKRYTDYSAMYNAFANGINDYRDLYGVGDEIQLTIAIPYMIGCGLAGGDWGEVQKVLLAVEKNCNVVFVAYDICS